MKIDSGLPADHKDHLPLTDSTDNARGPERIWHAIDRRGKIEACPDAHVQPCDDVASAYVGYTRADLAPTPLADPRVAALVKAAKEMVSAFYSNGNVTERHLRACKAGVALDAALAAFDTTGGTADG